MKKFYCFLLLSFLTFSSSIIAEEYVIENMIVSGDFVYWLYDDLTADIIGYANGGNLTATGTVESGGKVYTVKKIGGIYKSLVPPSMSFAGSKEIVRLNFEFDGSEVLEIDDDAFTACVGLEELSISNGGNIVFGNKSFSSCIALQKIKLNSQSKVYFKERCFENCFNLYSLDYASCNVEYEDYAFANCSNFSVFPVPRYVSKWSGNEQKVLDGCSNIKVIDWYAENADFGAGVTVNPLFNNIKDQITTVQLQSTVREIPDHFVEDFTNLSQVVTYSGAKITNIGARAFFNTALTTVPSTNGYLQDVDDSAFANCKIEKVFLPASLKSLGHYAFGSNPVKEVTVDAYIPPAAECDVFDECQKKLLNIKLNVPQSSVEQYRKATMWSNFFADYVNISSVSEDASMGTTYICYNPAVTDDCDCFGYSSRFEVEKDAPLCITLYATPAAGYTFSYWSRDGVKIGNTTPLKYTDNAYKNIQYVAHFEKVETPEPNKYSLVVRSDDPSLGYAYFEYNEEMDREQDFDLSATSLEIEEEDVYYIKLVAKPGGNAKFSHWTWNGQYLSDKAVTYDYDMYMQTDVEYVAYFEPMDYVTLSARSSDSHLGAAYIMYNEDMDRSQDFNLIAETIEIEEGGFYDVILCADAQVGVEFLEWTLNDVSYSESPVLSITNTYMTESEYFVAHFAMSAKLSENLQDAGITITNGLIHLPNGTIATIYSTTGQVVADYVKGDYMLPQYGLYIIKTPEVWYPSEKARH